LVFGKDAHLAQGGTSTTCRACQDKIRESTYVLHRLIFVQVERSSRHRRWCLTCSSPRRRLHTSLNLSLHLSLNPNWHSRHRRQKSLTCSSPCKRLQPPNPEPPYSRPLHYLPSSCAAFEPRLPSSCLMLSQNLLTLIHIFQEQKYLCIRIIMRMFKKELKSF
jgi:hypothetical protein